MQAGHEYMTLPPLSLCLQTQQNYNIPAVTTHKANQSAQRTNYKLHEPHPAVSLLMVPKPNHKLDQTICYSTMSPIQPTPLHALLGPNQTSPTKSSTHPKPKLFSQTGFKPRYCLGWLCLCSGPPHARHFNY
jgi:hypothetical protein